jgi:hypothetical protein
MKFVIVDPWKHEVRRVNARDANEAEVMAGLQPGQVDFGEAAPNVGIIVFEFGLLEPPAEQRYFTVGSWGGLYAGAAVLYAFDDDGETVDLDEPPPVRFLDTREEVEAAIAAGTVRRPYTSVNGVVLWEWPDQGGMQ